ncbi:MAG TPA: cytochrome c [Actinomycetota bacterium]
MGVVALSGLAITLIVLGVLVALAFVAALVWLGLRGRPERGPDIPAGMRPGPPDEMLERRFVDRFLGWSFLFVIFFAVWLAGLWLMEPQTNADDAVTLTERSVERGSMWFAISDEANPTGFGCARCHGPAGTGGQEIPFGDGFVQPPALNDVCGGPETGHPLIESINDVRTTIEQGRPGTAMPSWSIRYEGAMNDQQIDDLLNYLLTIQELPDGAQNVCLEPLEGAEDGTGGNGGEEGGA